MSVECGMGNGRKIRFIIAIIIFIGIALWYGYDGWLNEEFRAEHSSTDVLLNQVIAVVSAVALVVAAVRLVMASGSRVVADDSGIDVYGKYKIAWSDMVRVDDSKWEKGLVRVYYQRDGQEREYLVDSYMLDCYDDLLDEISHRRPDLLPPAEVEEQQND
ncbi:MAG: hypothetical protein GXY33_18185 [Phycisphaerae bacterium]|nr:hypothetical protein [Phycisphaerae bacterium]